MPHSAAGVRAVSELIKSAWCDLKRVHGRPGRTQGHTTTTHATTVPHAANYKRSPIGRSIVTSQESFSNLRRRTCRNPWQPDAVVSY